MHDNRGLHRRRTGQTLAEFAITLPILLALIFGTIEFGRAFQAWVTIENAAREATRYTTTGQYDQTKYILSELIPCTPDDSANFADRVERVPFALNDDVTIHLEDGAMTGQALFATYYDGQNCDPGRNDHLDMRRDIVRLASIYDVARQAISGLSVEPSRQDGSIEALFEQLSHQWIMPRPRLDQPGYFDVLVCSTRSRLDELSGFYDRSSRARFSMVYDFDEDLDLGGADYPYRYFEPPFCMLNEVPARFEGEADDARVTNYGLPWLDAGGPGDRVTISVTFNHPLITPIFPQDLAFFTMTARRSGVNETFRVSRALNAVQGGAPVTGFVDPPAGIDPPDPGPGPDPDPQPEPEPEPEPEPQPDPPTPIPPFDCDLMTVSDITFIQTTVVFRIRNENFRSSTLKSVNLSWAKPPYAPNMFLQSSSLDTEVHWNGVRDNWPFMMTNPQQNSNSDLTDIEINNWDRAERLVRGTEITGGSFADTTYRARYANVGSNALGRSATNPFGLVRQDFGGTTLVFGNPDGGPDCVVTIPTRDQDPEDPPDFEPPNFDDITPEDCATDAIDVIFDGFETFGIVRLVIRNNRSLPSPLIGFDLFWFDADPEPPIFVPEYNRDIATTVERVTGQPENLYLQEVIVAPLGSGPFSGSAVKVWEGPDYYSRTVNNPDNRADGTWIRNYDLPPNSTSFVYLNYFGTSQRLDRAVSNGGYGMQPYMFSGEFWITCTLPDGTDGTGIGNIEIGRPGFSEPFPPPTPIPPEVPTNTPVPEEADIRVQKSASTTQPIQDTIFTYTVTVTNDGPRGTSGVQITDVLQPGLTYISHNAERGTYNQNDGIWFIGNLGNRETVRLTIQVRASGNVGQTIPNTATSIGTPQTTGALPDPVSSNNQATVNITIQAPPPPRADIAITKTVDKPTVDEEEIVVFTVRARNNGPDNATGVVVTDVLPAGLTYISHTTSQGNYNQSTGVWNVGNINVNGHPTLTITARVNTGTAGTQITNTARRTASSPEDANPGNDVASATVTVRADDDFDRGDREDGGVGGGGQ